MTSPRPPSYINTPVPIAYADVDDALIVTMTRILGLCWSHDYERTPALAPDQLSDLTGRPRTTLYRHLGILERELGWLRIDRADRRLILRPLVGGMSQNHHLQDLQRQPVPSARSPGSGHVNKELQLFEVYGDPRS